MLFKLHEGGIEETETQSSFPRVLLVFRRAEFLCLFILRRLLFYLQAFQTLLTLFLLPILFPLTSAPPIFLSQTFSTIITIKFIVPLPRFFLLRSTTHARS